MTTKTTTKPEGKSRRKAATTAATKAADSITEVQNGGGQIAYVIAGKEKVAVPAAKLRGDLLALASVGSSLSAFRAALGAQPKPRLAGGVDGRNAPHSAAAVAATKATTTKATTTKATTTKATTTKATKAKSSGNFAYKVGAANDARVGTWRHYMLAIIQAHGDRASAEAAHAAGKFAGFKPEFAKSNLDVRWALKSGFIVEA